MNDSLEDEDRKSSLVDVESFPATATTTNTITTETHKKCKWILCDKPSRTDSHYCSEACGLLYVDLRRRYELFNARRVNDDRLNEEIRNLEQIEERCRKQRDMLDQLERSIEDQKQSSNHDMMILHRLHQEWISMSSQLQHSERLRQECRVHIDQQFWTEEQNAHQTITHF
jgi:predicted nucleic acid-binding Zn ribbon protein